MWNSGYTDQEIKMWLTKHKRCKNIPLRLINVQFLDILKETYSVLSWKLSLKNIADYRYSKYIRKSKSKDWICECITCWNKFKWDDTPNIQNWHFKTRRFLKYRFMDNNCRPQCWRCNCALNGNYKVYTLKMIERFWLDRVEKVEYDNEIYKISNYEYVEMIKDYYLYIKDDKKWYHILNQLSLMI